MSEGSEASGGAGGATGSDDAAGSAGTAGAQGPVAGGDARQRYRLYVAAAVLLLVLNGIDLVLTLVARSRGVAEANPFSAYLFDHAGVVLAVKFAIPLALLALALTKSGRRRIDELHLAAIWVVTGIYVMTVVVNAMAVFATSG